MGTIPVQTRSLAVDWAVWMLQSALALATAALSLLFTWYVRRQQRLDLAALDERALQDIGLSRADVAREVDKPFWR